MEKDLTRLRAAVPEEMYVPRRMRVCVRSKRNFYTQNHAQTATFISFGLSTRRIKKKTIYQFLSSARHRTYKSTSDCITYGS